ncbi:MAG: hypothetical protein GY743_23525 [Planctomycetaceae bacterium]|nr:hypothetical protein [Planctomycetaceae bacterium]
MSKKKRWVIVEGIYDEFFLEEVSGDSIALVSEPDDTRIPFNIDQIDDIIVALQQAKAHFAEIDQLTLDREAMGRWGKERIPTSE